MRQRVALVGQKLLGLAQDSRVAADGAERLDHPIGHIGNGTLRAMRVRLDYGTEGLDVDLPDERITVIEPIARPPAADPLATLRDAIRTPRGAAPLRPPDKPKR